MCRSVCVMTPICLCVCVGPCGGMTVAPSLKAPTCVQGLWHPSLCAQRTQVPSLGVSARLGTRLCRVQQSRCAPARSSFCCGRGGGEWETLPALGSGQALEQEQRPPPSNGCPLPGSATAHSRASVCPAGPQPERGGETPCSWGFTTGPSPPALGPSRRAPLHAHSLGGV